MDGIFTNSYIKIEGASNTREYLTILECLRQHASTKPEEEAFVFASTEGNRQKVTWSELYGKSQIVAKSFLYYGLKKREIVAVNIQSCPEWLYATFGAIMAGAIPVSIAFTYTDGSDLVALMERLKKCSFLIMDAGLDDINWNIIRKLLTECNTSGKIKSQKMPFLRYLFGYAFSEKIYSTHVKRFVDLLQEEHPEITLPTIVADDILCLFQTSGSTGVPKLVVYTHDMVLSAIDEKIMEWLDPKYTFYNDRPFRWSGGFPYSVVTGQKRVTTSGYCKPPKDRVTFMMNVIDKERCSIVFVLPPLMHELIKKQRCLPTDWPVEEIVVAGQPLTSRLVASIPRVCRRITCVYGGTEFICLTEGVIFYPERFTEYCCGKPLTIPGLEMKIVDESERIVPVNTRGEIYARSTHIFKGYFNDPGKTKFAFTDDKWFKTDDIGRMNENGEFFVEGRKSNMIISGGCNVAPEILEQAMKHFPGVATVIVVPIPDNVFHQVLCACVIKKEGSEITDDVVRKYCEDFHADKPGLFTVLPTYYIFLEKFPVTSSGKADRKELQKIAVKHCTP